MNWRDVRELLASLLLAIVVFLAIQSAIQTSTVDGASMEPNLHTGERLLINKAAYWAVQPATMFWLPPSVVQAQHGQLVEVFSGPQRGDLVVFRPPVAPEDVYVKRVIGLPGDTIEIKNGYVFLNTMRLEEPYANELSYQQLAPLTVPPGSLFVMGDNRNHSSDSVRWGVVPRENVLGRADMRLWPFDTASWGLAQRPIMAKK